MRTVHFIGIGGIGMSALAQYYLAKGWRVSGSDLAESEMTGRLARAGANIAIGHRTLNLIEGVERVIFSAAVKDDNPELGQAKVLGARALSYAEALGELTRQYLTVAVSGAHGKSTTAALLALMLIEAGLDPTVIIGTRLKEFGGGNFRLGASRYLVIEADEYDRSFWRYYPTIAVITNIDREHLDTYDDFSGVVDGFVRYFGNVMTLGALIVNEKDGNTAEALRRWKAVGKTAAPQIINYSYKRWPLKIPGRFNQLNAEAAWQAVRFLGARRPAALRAARAYAGSWRRLEPLAPKRPTSFAAGQKFFSDYAHHPTEIRATIGALKESFPKKKLAVVFQPHQLQRLTYLFDDFSAAFTGCHRLALLPAYQVAGRETEQDKTSHDLFLAIKERRELPECYYLKNFPAAVKLMRRFGGTVIVFMGAGDIDGEVRKFFTSKLL